MKMSAGGGGEFPVMESDTYLARLRAILPIGPQDGKYGVKEQMIWQWEFVTEETDDGPPNLSSFFNISFSEKSNLFKVVNSLSPKAAEGIKKEIAERGEVDLSKLLNMPALITVEKFQNDEGYDKNRILNITKPMKGATVPELVNETLYYDFEDPNWPAVFNTIPEWIQKKANTPTNQPTNKKTVSDIDEDDIPVATDGDDGYW